MAFLPTMKRSFFTILIVLLAFAAESQSFYAIRRDRSLILVAGSGTATYFGELKNHGEVFDTRPNITAGLQYYLTNRISLRSEFTYFNLKGDDAKANDESRLRRNLSFTSGNFELNVVGAINLFPNGHRFYQRPRLNVYPFIGIGVLYMNPKAALNGTKYALQPLKTEGVAYSRFQPVIPYGVGGRMKVGPFFNIAVEGCWRLMFTDYLDDVSTVYPDPASFSDPTAAALSMRYATPVPAGTKRGNPERNDGYFLMNVKIEYYLYNQKRKAYYRRN